MRWVVVVVDVMMGDLGWGCVDAVRRFHDEPAGHAGPVLTYHEASPCPAGLSRLCPRAAHVGCGP